MSQEILIVDDDPMIREVVKLSLEDLPYTIKLFDCGNAALDYCREKADRNEIKLVISDVRMPNGDGYFLTQEVRELYGDKPPIVIMTGYSEYDSRKLLEIGASAHLEKPASPESLLLTVEKMLQTE